MAQYISWKIRILKELGIKMTPKQVEHFKSLNTEIAIDQFAHDLICGIVKKDVVFC